VAGSVKTLSVLRSWDLCCQPYDYRFVRSGRNARYRNNVAQNLCRLQRSQPWWERVRVAACL